MHLAPPCTPECFLFDKNGKLIYHGAIDDSPSSDAAGVNRHTFKRSDEWGAVPERKYRLNNQNRLVVALREFLNTNKSRF